MKKAYITTYGTLLRKNICMYYGSPKGMVKEKQKAYFKK